MDIPSHLNWTLTAVEETHHFAGLYCRIHSLAAAAPAGETRAGVNYRDGPRQTFNAK
ncbi:hypothetical protein RMS29_025800 (plasmid) [Agrobacterium rosae]|uniref:Uncharacterized protein n=1 Tax=Agrobacterium rosae TaxID=1972867 RepID=A0AAW9FPJ7_9HYPH|nr:MULTISPECIES: hypothetical protein [Agrobacterium]MDX8321435.1 hypothetical protein [Agrobacterium sp. rho-8.1]MDX8305512.1 hypothetical protein [Agrobacterium rosae]MDX8310978.1 hypothetical protein [Agrobacterium sp. rho-13.3]MDX8316887.1 hypothetical protein [Agrobacterium rosae]MDX8332752.1 hypothetical protein [Agrobacterium rosae]